MLSYWPKTFGFTFTFFQILSDHYYVSIVMLVVFYFILILFPIGLSTVWSFVVLLDIDHGKRRVWILTNMIDPAKFGMRPSKICGSVDISGDCLLYLFHFVCHLSNRNFSYFIISFCFIDCIVLAFSILVCMWICFKNTNRFEIFISQKEKK